MVGAEPVWLTVQQVVDRLRAAGYVDSPMTVRRMVDDGEFGPRGEAWYRTERGGYRMVTAAAVDRLVAKRRSHTGRNAPPSS